MLISLTVLSALVLSSQHSNNANRILTKSFVPSSIVQEVPAKAEQAELSQASELASRAVKLFVAREYEEALPLAKRALQIREKMLNPDDQLIRSSLINIAELYLALRKYSEAEGPLQRVIKSYKKTDPNNVRLVYVLENMAIVQYVMRRLDKAESAYQEALRISEKAFGAEDSRTMQSVFRLAEFYHLSSKYEEAIPYYQRLLSFREKHKSPSEQLKEVVDRYSCVLRKLNREEEANNLDKKFSITSIGTENPSEARTHPNVLNGRAITMPRPGYPAEALKAGVSGKVIVLVLIDERGKVLRACAIKGPELLRRASEVAAYQASFTPTTLSGMPVKVSGIITYNYVAR